jgi:tuberculosinol/isotuberculosinol synthase
VIEFEAFLNLKAVEVADLVRESGPQVCVFPINGTRRWFMLEHMPESEEDLHSAYLDVGTGRHIELYQLVFDHGIATLLTPAFGPDLLERGERYVQLATEGLARLASHSAFLDFYERYGVRVRFYGEYRRFFRSTPYDHLPDLFLEAQERTAMNDRCRLFFGVCADDAVETTARLAIRYYQEHGRAPDRRALVSLYYGEHVEPVDLFIGFDKFCVFDMPLLATGDEDLYFTVSPSPYLSGRQLRAILYDHLYARRGGEPEYGRMKPEDWEFMREFYRLNRVATLGVGARRGDGGLWYPLPQVAQPSGPTNA